MEQKQNITLTQRNYAVKDLTLSALCIALVFIATKFINIRLPISVNGGLIHLGNVMLFSIAILLGKKKGAIAGAFGMAIFDLLSGWVIWAPFTFVVRGVMGYIIGSIANAKNRNGEKLSWNLFGIILAGIWMLFGYYVTEITIYGNWLAPVTSIPGNIVQIVFGAVLGIPLAASLIKLKIRKFL